MPFYFSWFVLNLGAGGERGDVVREGGRGSGEERMVVVKAVVWFWWWWHA